MDPIRDLRTVSPDIPADLQALFGEMEKISPVSLVTRTQIRIIRQYMHDSEEA